MIVHGVFIVFWQFNADFVLRQTFEKSKQDACGNVELNPHLVWIIGTEVVLVHFSVPTVKRSSDFFRGKSHSSSGKQLLLLPFLCIKG